MMRWRAALLGWLAAGTLGLAGAAETGVRVFDDRGHALTLPRPARRIVSLLPSLTETVCALRACDRLVGTDRHSDWPAAVRDLPKLGGLEDSQIERIVALKPDLVLVAVSARAIDRLEALGLPVLALEPRNWADAQRVIDRVARALGEPAAGPALVEGIEARIAAATARVPPALRGRTVYFEVAANPYAAGEASFVGELLTRLGLVNIVPTSMGPFPQLNPEFILRAQPAIVMGTAAAVADMPGRPGWRSLAALRHGQVCGYAAGPYDTLVRPGPRLGDAAEAIVDCLARLGSLPP